MKFDKSTLPRMILAGSFVVALGAYAPAAFAQAPAPPVATGVGPAGNPGTATSADSGGTAPAPSYGGPAAASGANSPPVNSGITDPKTGANNDTPGMATNPPAVPVTPGSAPPDGTAMNPAAPAVH